MLLRIIVPGKPTGKGRARFSRATGRAYTPEQTARRENLIALAARDAMAGKKLLEDALAVRVDVFMQVPKSFSRDKKSKAYAGLLRPTSGSDVDNILKTLDVLNGIVWVDDKQIVELCGYKYYSDTPRMEITIKNALGGQP